MYALPCAASRIPWACLSVSEKRNMQVNGVREVRQCEEHSAARNAHSLFDELRDALENRGRLVGIAACHDAMHGTASFV
eukprot:355093-Chlamydomonas_euryale.AAC.3